MSNASQEIDDIIQKYVDWRGQILAKLRSIINQADPNLIEEVKWKKPSKPEGVPVWSHNGNLCIAESLKSAVRLTFPKGAQIKDPKKLFNTRLDSKVVRAIDYYEDTLIDEEGLINLIVEAARQNDVK